MRAMDITDILLLTVAQVVDPVNDVVLIRHLRRVSRKLQQEVPLALKRISTKAFNKTMKDLAYHLFALQRMTIVIGLDNVFKVPDIGVLTDRMHFMRDIRALCDTLRDYIWIHVRNGHHFMLPQTDRDVLNLFIHTVAGDHTRDQSISHTMHLFAASVAVSLYTSGRFWWYRALPQCTVTPNEHNKIMYPVRLMVCARAILTRVEMFLVEYRSALCIMDMYMLQHEIRHPHANRLQTRKGCYLQCIDDPAVH